MAGELAVEIIHAGLAADTEPLVAQLVEQRVASRLGAQDPALWGPDAQAEASRRLAWTVLPETSRPLLAEIDALRAELRADGLDRVVLAGMGGSSLAPEVICASAGTPLTVLDTTDPGPVADALAGDLERTVLVVSSKSGTTLETECHRRAFTAAFADIGLDPAKHLVAVTDPDSPLHRLADKKGYRRVVTADPKVGGRYSALSAFGLVPAGLAGADVAALLDDAMAVTGRLVTDDPGNPALRLAAAFAAAHGRGAEKLVLADTGSGTVGFPGWAEQLIAESTGKQGIGLLPVVVEGPRAPGYADAGQDAIPVALGPADEAAGVRTGGPLGAQFQLWEQATALAGRLLGVNPFDQPDVEAAKSATLEQLDSGPPESGAPAFTDCGVQAHPLGDWLPGEIDTLTDALRALLGAVPRHGYLAVQAYLDRTADASAAVLRAELARRSGVQTTFGWGPRYLHSTGQYHKGGHQNGVFLQLSGEVEEDLPVPHTSYTFGTLQRAQALGDGRVLAGRGRPVLRLHLTDRAAGLVAVVKAVQELT